MGGATWLPAPERPALDGDEVHVWRASLDTSKPRVSALLSTLSNDEAERARRFRFRKHRDRYVVGRGVLRAVLAQYLDTPPDRLRFCYSEHGKPSLAGEAALRFNVSHSDALALYAIAGSRELGVDLERRRNDRVDQEVAERFFSGRRGEGPALAPGPGPTRRVPGVLDAEGSVHKGKGRRSLDAPGQVRGIPGPWGAGRPAQDSRR